MDVASLHSRSVAEWVRRLETVDDRWDQPTPCGAWNVRALVNHVVAEDLWTVPMMEGATIEEVGDRFEGDVLGDDPVATGRAAAEAAAAVTAQALAERRIAHLSFGDTPAEEYAYQLAADHVIHGWDLAVATGGDPEMDPDLVEALAVWFAEREELYRSSGVIGERPDDGGEGTATGDDAQGRLLRAFGREPGWCPPLEP
ncbi:MAG TPA: TIGR03086 family metal-binding protein [Acidimicrobiales bacterium]